MLPYWLIFLFLVLACVLPRRLKGAQREGVWRFAAFVLIVFIGLRHEVGGDWFSYLFNLEYASQRFDNALELGDPGYYVLGWLFVKIGGSIYWLNVFCAAILVSGTFRLANAQPRPWLALVIALPYLLIVVGMGYTRQAAAIGLVMWGLVALQNKRVVVFSVSVLCAALFHKTALLMLPIAALAHSRRRIWTAVWVAVLFMLGFIVLLDDDVDALYSNYVISEYAFASEGAAVRLAMNAVAAVIFILFSRRLVNDRSERQLYWWLSWVTVACLPFLAISPTAVDRIALYLIPLQLVIFSRLPDLAGRKNNRQTLYLSVIAYYALVQFVWLNFASNRSGWVPYEFVPLTAGF
ncbi:MAG TPA: EpsG family protein [Elainellaceae cyanobacterium]